VKYIDPDGRQPQSYKMKDGEYAFYAVKDMSERYARSVFRDIFLIPFMGDYVLNIIEARFGYRNIDTGSRMNVLERFIYAVNNLSTTVSDASFIAEIFNYVNNTLSIGGLIATGLNWAVAIINGVKESRNKDSLVLDIIIEEVFGKELRASTHDGVAYLYIITRFRLDRLKERGAFSYSTDNDGRIRYFLDKSSEEQLKKDLRDAKKAYSGE
jgi:hypothetical protein